MSDEFIYQGSELDLFARATNWKAYWSNAIRPYVGSRVLEVGAGTGATVRQLCGQNQEIWLALEPDAGLAACMNRDKAQGLLPNVVDVRDGTIEDVADTPTFDTVLYIDVLEHIEDDRQQLASAVSRLRPGGHLVVLAPAHQFLFAPFDQAIGHFRRYSRNSIAAVGPPDVATVKIVYLDSVGLIASLGNRFLLKASMPTRQQIGLWDKAMVPASRVVDRLLAYRLGKSVLAVWQKPGGLSGGSGR